MPLAIHGRPFGATEPAHAGRSPHHFFGVGGRIGLNPSAVFGPFPFQSKFLFRSAGSKSTFAPPSGTSPSAHHRIAFTTTRRKPGSPQFRWKWPPVNPKLRPPFG